MTPTISSTPARSLGALAAALRSKWRAFALGVVAVVALDVFVPPLVLSVARKPVDFFTFNPWLTRLPEYLASGPDSLAHRLARTWDLALFWFSSDNPYGIEWGFAVTTADLARFLLMGLLVGAYFALWLYRREQVALEGWGARVGGHGGTLGAVASVFGVATGGCTVMGCGAPVMPVIGLAFAGLTSTTLKWLSGVSAVATPTVLVAMAAAVAYLAWRAGAPGAPAPRATPARAPVTAP